MAIEANLDLVQMSTTDIPVCKILNNSKLEYEEKKKLKHNKNLNVEKFKEVKFKTAISEHDLNTKINHINEFLNKGFRVQVAAQIMNRQVNGNKVAKGLLDNTLLKITSPYKMVSEPEVRGNLYSVTICSNKEGKK